MLSNITSINCKFPHNYKLLVYTLSYNKETITTIPTNWYINVTNYSEILQSEAFLNVGLCAECIILDSSFRYLNQLNFFKCSLPKK